MEAYLEWPSSDGIAKRAVDTVIHPYLGAYYLRAGLGPNDDLPSVLLIWWALLLLYRSSLAMSQRLGRPLSTQTDHSSLYPLSAGFEGLRSAPARRSRGPWNVMRA
jgi:hypothetical protein